MIPKIIHWCWLSGDPIPENLQRYMDSWKRLLPDYEFIHWDFERFPRGKCEWVDQAFDTHKYAFAADYIRLYALYNYGGFYLDMDVEVLKNFDELLNHHVMLGCDSDGFPEVAAFGAEKGNGWIGLCLDAYNQRSFIKKDGSYETEPLPAVIKRLTDSSQFNLKNVHGLDDYIEGEDEICILPSEYFGPKSYATGEIHTTNHTFLIHHFAGSWIPKYERLEKKIWLFLGLKPHCIIGKVLNLFKR